MLKDRAQKASALRLAVSKRWLPQLEVDIEPSLRMEKSKYLLTDLDVLAIAPATFGAHTRMIFDCKSGAKESAIGRAFWLHGVMARSSAAHGFVVLNEKVTVNREHRISASDLNITLLHESEMDVLAKGMGASITPTDSVAASIDAWEQFLTIKSQYPALSEYLAFSRSGYWMLKDPGEQCRKAVARLRAIRAELDPAKSEHLAVFGDALCLFLLALSEMAVRLFLVLLRPSSHDEYSSSLLALLYGGYENLEAAQKIRRLTSGADVDDAVSIFPEMPRFEQLMREVLQAPLQALPAALLAREIGFCFLTGTSTSVLQGEIAKESEYAPKFVLLAATYLQKALKLPPEFSSDYSDKAMILSAAALRTA
ncbi:hypothetical protein [Burkholderia gladioli]|uniref:hypothetical protein n=1 Tax=Burkholderia gladioli TaxID=28095 RepID=UPI00163F857E|nr:hypothetical protein [Burkholderia gladioli]MDA0573920.1 hypothetical protein [Burkholderia gladioli]MDA0603295.1 hypothetical protein [Burkholderia gladioli]